MKFVCSVDAAPSLGVYYFLSLTLSVCVSVCRYVCMSVTVLLQIDSSFFVSRWNRAFFWPSSLLVALYKTFDFRFRPPNAHNLLPKICMSVIESVMVCGSWFVRQRHFELGAESSRLPACLSVCLCYGPCCLHSFIHSFIY